MAIFVRIARTDQDLMAIYEVRREAIRQDPAGKKGSAGLEPVDAFDSFQETLNLLICDGGRPVGCMRLCRKGGQGLPIEPIYAFPTLLPYLGDGVVSVDRVELARGYRARKGILIAALKLAVHALQARGARHLLALVRTELAAPFHRAGLEGIGGPHYHEAQQLHYLPLYAPIDGLRSPFMDWAQREELTVLGEALERSIYTLGEVICQEGSSGDAAYLVARGSVGVTRNDARGREVLIDILGPGELFGELSVLDFGPRSATARAYSRECDLLTIGREEFRSQVLAHPVRAEAMMRMLARRLRGSAARLAFLQPESVTPLLLTVLCDAAASAELGREGPLQGVTLEWLAGQVGRPPSLLAELLMVLERQGLISWKKGSLVVHDLDGLRACQGELNLRQRPRTGDSSEAAPELTSIPVQTPDDLERWLS